MLDLANLIGLFLGVLFAMVIILIFYVGAFYVIFWLVSFFLSGNIAVVASLMILFIIIVSGAILR